MTVMSTASVEARLKEIYCNLTLGQLDMLMTVACYRYLAQCTTTINLPSDRPIQSHMPVGNDYFKDSALIYGGQE